MASRQEFVEAAVKFLQNPKLMSSGLQEKLQFLKDKGLTGSEVDEALNLALINRHQPQTSKWNFLLVLGLAVGGYKLYTTYLESKEVEKKLLAQRENHEKQEERERLDTEKMNLEQIMQKMNELKRLLELQRTNISTDIQSLKTLLLGHERFAAPPVIPEWQLKNAETK